MEEKQWNAIIKKIKRNVFVPMNHAAGKENVANVSPTIGTWESFRDVYSLLK